MVEVVILLPVMLLMWAGIDYFRAGYVRRLQAMQMAQTAGWKSAMSNDGSCFSQKESWAGFSGSNDPTAGTGSAASTFIGGTGSSLFQYGHAKTQQQLSTTAATFNSNAVSTLTAGFYVTCDEVVPVDNSSNSFADSDVFTPLKSYISSLISTSGSGTP